MKKLIIASFATIFILTGCNTMKGLGKDVSKAAEAVSSTSDDK